MNKLWWFIRNQIAKAISTNNRFATCRSWRTATVAILPAGVGDARKQPPEFDHGRQLLALLERGTEGITAA